MTRDARPLAARLLAGVTACALALSPALALGQTVETSPQMKVTPGATKDHVQVDFPDEAFMEEREISRIVQEVYGPGADLSNGRGPDPAVEALIDVGQPLPAAADAKPAPQALASRLPQGPRWLSVGEDLVAVDEDGRVTRVYHDMLP